ncbi:VENN motif pre-toxin domain-containing protein, partial [Snodgrassella communis]|uniref:VENN motif pre-toxin domain-containing protein n=1 Tax=Snodgrassella communis TaxID=2946699 RepID=UPI0015D56D6B
MQATSAFINSKKDKLKEELKQENLSPEQRAQYEKELAQWNSGGLILNAIGAGLAAAGGNDALAGGLAAAGAEATAPIVSKWLYGKDAKDLTADEKATVSAIAGLTGAATGVTVGGSMADVAQGDQAGHIAVDNNTVLGDKIREYIENARQYWHT